MAFGSISSVLKQRFAARFPRGANKQRKQQALLSPPPSLPDTHFLPASPSAPVSIWLAPLLLSHWLLLYVATVSLTLFTLLRLSSPTFSIIQMSLMSVPSFPCPPSSPQASSSCLISLAVLGIDNIDNLTRAAFLTANLITQLPRLKNP